MRTSLKNPGRVHFEKRRMSIVGGVKFTVCGRSVRPYARNQMTSNIEQVTCKSCREQAKRVR